VATGRRGLRFFIGVIVFLTITLIIVGWWLYRIYFAPKKIALTKENLPDGVVQVLGGTPAKPLNLPLDVSVAPNGRIFVADAGNNAVQTFYPWGQPQGLFGKKIEFVYPNTVAADENGYLYVGEFNAGRIRVFTPKGTPKLTIDRQTAGVPLEPLDLAVANGRLYVADRRGAVYVLNEKGKLLYRINRVPAEPHRLSFPNGIAVDADGRFLVADSGNRRLLLFAPEGKFLQVIENSLLLHPRGTAFWGKNCLVVADPIAGQVVVLDNNGRLIKCLRAEEEEGLRQIVPNGLAVYGDRLYVTDRAHNVVIVFGRRR